MNSSTTANRGSIVNPKSESISLDDIYSVNAFKQRFDHFFQSDHELEYILRNRRLNGLERYGAVIQSRTGRRLSIIAPRFTSWWLQDNIGGEL